MAKEYKFCIKENIPEDYEKILLKGISQEAFQAKGLNRIRNLGIFICDCHEKLLGGITGTTLFSCLYIDLLWIHKDYRHHGWGTKLVLDAEKISKKRGCTFSTVNTMDWQALSFYEELGYFVEFTREGFTNHSKMYLLRKNFL